MGSGPFIIGVGDTVCGRNGIVIGSENPDCICGGGCDCRCPDGTVMPASCCGPNPPENCRCLPAPGDPCCTGLLPGHFSSGAGISVQFSVNTTVTQRFNAGSCSAGSTVAEGSFTGGGVIGTADTLLACGEFSRILVPNSTPLPGSGSGECFPPCGSGSGPYTAQASGSASMLLSGGITSGISVNVLEGGSLCSVASIGSLSVSVSQNCLSGVATPTVSPGNSGTPGVGSWAVNTINSATGLSASVTRFSHTVTAAHIIETTTNLSYTVIGATLCPAAGPCIPVVFPECADPLERVGGRLYVPRRLISIPTAAQVRAVARGGRVGGCSSCNQQEGLE